MGALLAYAGFHATARPACESSDSAAMEPNTAIETMCGGGLELFDGSTRTCVNRETNPNQPAQDNPMHALRNIITVILLVACLAGCSHDGNATGRTGAAAPTSSAPKEAVISTKPMGPVDNACGLLTDAEIRQVFPSAGSGKRNTQSLEYGLDRCAWKISSGQVGVEVSKVAPVEFESDLRGELQAAVDPRVQGALDRIRFHAVEGIGDHAIAVLEKVDAHNGLYTDIALLAIQRGQRMVVLTVPGSLSEAPSTLASLNELGSMLAPRL